MAFMVILFFARSFFHLPGLQLELIELGRQSKTKGMHIIYTCILGILGGIVIGGWVYLSSAYSIGADNYPIATGQFAAEGDFKVYNTEMVRATEDFLKKEKGEEPPVRKMDPAVWGFVFASVVTAVLTVLRQLFAGFFFHPIGFILGSTPMLGQIWGSMFVAWVIRFAVLKLGGAATVRNKLIPFAFGIFLASIAAFGIFALINSGLYFFNPGVFKARVLF